ncbi:MAG: hypothetical protein OHK0012_21040 [Synechococcales cyanobacterium]
MEVMGQAPGADMTSRQALEEADYEEAVKLIQAREFRGAIQILNRLIHRSPNEVRYYLQRALAHQKQGNEGMALMDFQGILRLDPDSIEAQQGLALLDPAKSAAAAAATRASESRPIPIPMATQSRWLPWLAWMGANGVASGAAGWAGMTLMTAVAWPVPMLGAVVAGLLLGLALGLAQAGILGMRLPSRLFWLLASLVGYAATLGVMDLLAQINAIPMITMVVSPLGAIVGCIFVGFLQWLVLRQRPSPTFSWILTNGIDGIIVAGIASLTTAFPVLIWPLVVWVACRPIAGWLLLDLLQA